MTEKISGDSVIRSEKLGWWILFGRVFDTIMGQMSRRKKIPGPHKKLTVLFAEAGEPNFCTWPEIVATSWLGCFPGKELYALFLVSVLGCFRAGPWAPSLLNWARRCPPEPTTPGAGSKTRGTSSRPKRPPAPPSFRGTFNNLDGKWIWLVAGVRVLYAYLWLAWSAKTIASSFLCRVCFRRVTQRTHNVFYYHRLYPIFFSHCLSLLLRVALETYMQINGWLKCLLRAA